MDRVLGGVLGTFAVAAILIWLGPDPAITSWSAQAALEAIFTWLAWRLWRRPRQDSLCKRFWAAAAVAGALKTAGGVVRAIQFAVEPASAGSHRTVPTLLVAAGSLVLLGFLLARPPDLVGRERVRLWLDAATVLVAASVFVWSIALTGSESAKSAGDVAWTFIGSVIMIVSAFAIVRLLMTKDAPFSRATGIVLTVAIALFGVSHALNPQLADADSRGSYVLRLVPALVLALAPCVEWIRGTLTREIPPPKRIKVTARLPFIAVAATQLMLIIQLPIEGLTIMSWGTVVGSVVLTAVVAARQSVVLMENERLVRRLDESIEALGRQEEKLRHAANHDHLTGLANRAFFDHHAQRLGNGPPGRGRAVLLLDLNEFKMVNDTLGHHAGDDLLKLTATRLRRSVRPADTVARLGGDEFSVLLADASADDAVAAAHRILVALAKPVRVDGRTLRPSASVGIAASGVKPFERLLRDADEAMYEAKRRNSGFYVHPDSAA
ncbi:diguanylate cyclase [Asanoa sp. WMMD1127]|uniref:diguanylate cyclase domain-containing protein n=1 Tax=Asanoa sp. WMMD1127 TaxID=3016107 RepID=UPI0024166380|nr:diguanylate cyclase [Asanoa sp. WMMD1127]MDG4826651.1 diguanylate cyclase [Asanoa sp. WMMD1127]